MLLSVPAIHAPPRLSARSPPLSNQHTRLLAHGARQSVHARVRSPRKMKGLIQTKVLGAKVPGSLLSVQFRFGWQMSRIPPPAVAPFRKVPAELPLSSRSSLPETFQGASQTVHSRAMSGRPESQSRPARCGPPAKEPRRRIRCWRSSVERSHWDSRSCG